MRVSWKPNGSTKSKLYVIHLISCHVPCVLFPQCISLMAYADLQSVMSVYFRIYAYKNCIFFNLGVTATVTVLVGNYYLNGGAILNFAAARLSCCLTRYKRFWNDNYGERFSTCFRSDQEGYARDTSGDVPFQPREGQGPEDTLDMHKIWQRLQGCAHHRGGHHSEDQ